MLNAARLRFIFVRQRAARLPLRKTHVEIRMSQIEDLSQPTKADVTVTWIGKVK
jgi:hypothetical protein